MQKHMDSAHNQGKRIATFFYGSFMRDDVMALGDFYPDKVEVAKLSGFDINFDPHANIFRSEQHAIYGILVYPSHEELNKLYARDGIGVFLPEAVLIETQDNRLLPALCYMPPMRGSQPVDFEYLERIIGAANNRGFPMWYLKHLENFRQTSQ